MVKGTIKPKVVAKERRAIDKEREVEDAMRLVVNPSGFSDGLLGMPPYAWQDEILGWYGNIWGRVKGAVAAPNGAGKSSNIIAPLSLFWICMAPQATVVITSADSRQLDHQISPAFEMHRPKFPHFTFNRRNILSPTGGEIIAFTTDDAGRAEGWHHRFPDKPLLMIVDEAKTVRPEIYEAIDRCSYNGLLLISSTGRDSGQFYKAMMGMVPGFKTRKVSLTECPHVDPERIHDVIATYGPDHPFTRSTLHSEFISQDDENQFFFSKEKLDILIANPPDFKNANRVIYCDFGGGSDENVIAMRKGNKCSLVKCWHEPNEMVTIGQFIQQFRKMGLTPEDTRDIYADSAGFGKTMCNRFDEVGWPLHRINGCERAMRETEYANRSAEMWDTAAMAVEQAEVILPDDEIMVSQLVSRMRGKPDSRGRLLAESKPDMKKRGIKSPDRADAIVGCIAIGRPFWYGKNAHMISEPAMRKGGAFWDMPAYDEWSEDFEPPYLIIGSHAG